MKSFKNLSVFSLMLVLALACGKKDGENTGGNGVNYNRTERNEAVTNGGYLATVDAIRNRNFLRVISDNTGRANVKFAEIVHRKDELQVSRCDILSFEGRCGDMGSENYRTYTYRDGIESISGEFFNEDDVAEYLLYNVMNIEGDQNDLIIRVRSLSEAREFAELSAKLGGKGFQGELIEIYNKTNGEHTFISFNLPLAVNPLFRKTYHLQSGFSRGAYGGSNSLPVNTYISDFRVE